MAWSHLILYISKVLYQSGSEKCHKNHIMSTLEVSIFLKFLEIQKLDNELTILDMRIKYKDKSDCFTEDHLVSKEPFGQFKHWFEIACKTPGIQEANAVFLATATKYDLNIYVKQMHFIQRLHL